MGFSENNELEQQYQVALEHIADKYGIDISAMTSVEYGIEAAKTNNKKAPLIILSGMSGVGKSTIGSQLTLKGGYKKLRNTYTRPRRSSETDDDGIFIDANTFDVWHKEGRFAISNVTNGVMHGLLKSELELVHQPDSKLWADKSVSSMLKLQSHIDMENAQLVYLLPPSFEELYARLMKRESGTEQTLTEADIRARLTEEIKELKNSSDLPYAYIVNDDVDRVVNQLV